MQDDYFNIAQYLSKRADEIPFHPAVISPTDYDAAGRRKYTHLTYQQLHRLSDRYARGLLEYGIGSGIKTLLMVRPGLDFIALTYALFKVGAVPVLIDPGMGVSRLAECVRHLSPEGFVGIPKAHLLRVFKRRAFRSVKYPVTVGKKSILWNGVTLSSLTSHSDAPFEMAKTKRSDLAAILFTTGSTGPAKGVSYEHGMFDAQTKLIGDLFHIEVGDTDLPGFPLFSLFSIALGMTSVIPDMDPTRPAQVDPKKIIEAIEDFGITFTFGSPAIWRRVADYCIPRGITFPSIKRILMAGAPIPGDLLKTYQRILPNGETYTPYGATESLPSALISGSEIVRDTWQQTIFGAGVCMGRPVPDMTCAIITITDDPIDTFDESLKVPDGEIGEICWKGPVVTKEYANLPDHTARAKMRDPDGGIWHRMGDVGYLDNTGRLWFCGRKSHRVVGKDKTWFSTKCEAIYNQHPDVYRSALVGLGKRGNEVPAIVIEPVEGKMPKTKLDRERFKKSLIELGLKYDVTRDISIVLFHPSFPVDIRHNAKIFREKLKPWAEARMKG